MLADPQSVSPAGTAVSVARTGASLNEGTFQSSDGNVTLSIAHQFKKRNRHQVKLTLRKVAPDPLMPANNLPYSMSVYTVIDVPQTGFSASEIQVCLKALFDNLSASTYANAVKVIGGEI